eukprot:scaffold144716_cov61-Attheya_sp.AAC.1
MSEMTNENESKYYDIPLRQPSSEDDSEHAEQEIPSETAPIDHDALLNQKKPFKLSKSEKMDLVAALEHIVSRGHLLQKADSKCQQWAEGRQKRRQPIIEPSEETITTGTLDGSVLLVPDWIQREQQQQQMKKSDRETGEDDGEAPRGGGQKYISDRNVSSDQGERFPRLIHAEDWRIYSLNLPDGMLPNKKSSNPGTWPRSRNKKRVKFNEDNETGKETHLRTNVVDDTQWDEEQGDGIAQLDFVRDCLSSAATHRFNSGAGKAAPCFNTARGHLTPNEEDVPSLMLSRCWQRAVHAATCTIDAPHHVGSGDVEASPESQTQSVGMDDHGIEDVDKLSRLKEKAIRKCEEWDIQCMLPSSSTTALNESFECQSCQSSEFGTAQDLHCHFFGSSEARGCCWKLIEEKQIDMVHSILVKDVRFSLDGLLTVILSMVRKKKSHEKKYALTNSGGKHQSAVLNWEDVIDGLNEAVCKEHQSLNGEPANVQEKTPILSPDKIQVHPYLPSLDLNDDVVKAVSMRLVERYATMRY